MDDLRENVIAARDAALNNNYDTALIYYQVCSQISSELVPNIIFELGSNKCDPETASKPCYTAQ